MNPARTLALVLAGGEGTRLRPLTVHEAKPAVRFAGGCRIVDFVLANLVNSGVPAIYLLAQYKPETLIRHVNEAWVPCFDGAGILEVLLPQGCEAQYTGTADAVRQNLDLLERHQPDAVAVFASDHVYRMDLRPMLRFHRENAAHVTVAATPVPLEEASAFGVIEADRDGRIRRFEEKPQRPRPMHSRAGCAYASMGNYLFEPEALVQLLEDMARRGETDFGKHLMPFLPQSGYRALAYDFYGNEVPGIKPYEERAYWRDVGTLQALVRARADTLGPAPRFDLHNASWPILRRGAWPAAERSGTSLVYANPVILHRRGHDALTNPTGRPQGEVFSRPGSARGSPESAAR